MVSQVGTTPYSYYNVLNPVQPSAPPAPVNTGSNANAGNSTSTTPGTGANGSSSGTLALPPELVALLQAFSPANAGSQTYALLGGVNDNLTGTTENTILQKNYQAAMALAYQNVTQKSSAAPSNNALQQAMASRNSASNAYNAILLKQAQDAVNASKTNTIVA